MTVSDSPRPNDWQADAEIVFDAIGALPQSPLGAQSHAALERLVARLTQLESSLTALKHGEPVCGACGSTDDVDYRGWTDEGVPMLTCADCGSPGVPDE